MKVKRILASVFAGVVLIGGCVGVAVGYNGLSQQIDELTKQVETLTTENKTLTDTVNKMEADMYWEYNQICSLFDLTEETLVWKDRGMEIYPNIIKIVFKKPKVEIYPELDVSFFKLEKAVKLEYENGGLEPEITPNPLFRQRATIFMRDCTRAELVTAIRQLEKCEIILCAFGYIHYEIEDLRQ